jgi:hypothetical protein
MGMQATVLKAVKTAVKAIGDLAVPATHMIRTATVYAPGGATQYTSTNQAVDVVISSYESKEIEEDRELASDVKILVFNAKVIPKLNDMLTVNDKQYRVMRSKPTYAGSEIAFSTVQARPL